MTERNSKRPRLGTIRSFNLRLGARAYPAIDWDDDPEVDAADKLELVWNAVADQLGIHACTCASICCTRMRTDMHVGSCTCACK